MNAGEIITNLVLNDVRFEIMLDTIIEILESKKDHEGNPIFLKGEIEAKVKEKIGEANKKANRDSILTPRTGIITPGSKLLS